jgi:hypothetical protein
MAFGYFAPDEIWNLKEKSASRGFRGMLVLNLFAPLEVEARFVGFEATPEHRVSSCGFYPRTPPAAFFCVSVLSEEMGN